MEQASLSSIITVANMVLDSNHIREEIRKIMSIMFRTRRSVCFQQFRINQMTNETLTSGQQCINLYMCFFSYEINYLNLKLWSVWLGCIHTIFLSNCREAKERQEASCEHFAFLCHSFNTKKGLKATEDPADLSCCGVTWSQKAWCPGVSFFFFFCSCWFKWNYKQPW